MRERQVLSRLEREVPAPRVGKKPSAGSLGRPVGEEGKRVAQAIRMAVDPPRNVKRSDDRLLRMVVWSAMLLLCGLMWTAVAYFAAGAPPW